MMLFVYQGAQVTARDEAGVVMATIEGRVDVATAGRVIGDSIKWAKDPLVQIVDYRGAALELSADVLYGAATAAKPTEAAPTVFLVDPRQLAMFRRYAAMNAERGVLKAAFTCCDAVASWAAEQAQVREYWRRLAGTVAASP